MNIMENVCVENLTSSKKKSTQKNKIKIIGSRSAEASEHFAPHLSL